ncbi:MAG: Lipid A biosynthesis lauroyl acyltransferase [Lentisphaerae bacterium ADurb.BinA184]|nr:MAG: Lipid A biosynthesis lauroyl acyltransferase [Lentisphaerae bacterium ADurb.BinA184]
MRAAIALIFWLCGLWPAGVARRLGVALGWGLGRLLRFRRRDVEQHVALAFPDHSPGERRQLVHAIYRHFGLLAVEMLRMPRLPPDRLLSLLVFHGWEHAEQALARGRGLLVLAGHTGNWEMGLAGCALRAGGTKAVVKEIKGKAGQYAIDRIRGRHGVKTIPRRGGIREILSSLRANQPVGFVLDQNMTVEDGVFVEFFGHPACTMSGLAVLARRRETPVIPVAFYRDDDGRRHHVELLPEIAWEPSGGSAEDDLRHNTQRYTRILEAIIRRHPEQWIWMHRRWRTKPPAPPP